MAELTRPAGRQRLPTERPAAHPISRLLAMAFGGALSLIATLFRGAIGWTAAITGSALVKRGVTGEKRPKTGGQEAEREPTVARPRSSDPGALAPTDRPLESK
ncbi:MAG: hypothetical protein JNL21_11320 [Myxococcales bacterium]|nr:hypothetical protein [Myxococcales bacterium]